MEVVLDRTRLYKQASNGRLQFWEISSEDDLITITWGEDGGATQTQEEVVDDGLAGRSLEEQVISRVDSRINKKLDRGYVTDREIARTTRPVNRMGLKKPMLAARFDKVKNINYNGAMAQLKYDGHRCLVNYDGVDFTAYSRGGKPITSIVEIMHSVERCGLHPDFTLDGELYYHGAPLQRISSWVKRRQPKTVELEYIVYDVIPDDNDWSYIQRFKYLETLSYYDNLILAPTDCHVGAQEIPNMLDASRKSGYEGIIIRQDGFPYQDDKRSKGLVKVKAWFDSEYPVVGIMPSRDGYAVLTCRMDSGLEFDATAPGDMDDKFHVMENQKEYLGKFVTVQYACFTEAGKPFQPIATAWREQGD
jgi:ATP-dependent DNA ligase